MAVFTELMVLVGLTTGLGYWFWRLMRRPAPGRSLAWLWCGLAGFCLGMLCLQMLVYLDWPLRRTAPGLLLVALAGVVGLLFQLRRGLGPTGPRHWREVAWILGAGLVAGLGHSTSLIGIGSDRFLGHAQIDHVNYVITAQFLADEPFSTEVGDIRLRPWLWRPLELKNERITECVALGTVAILARTDAQRAWGSTAVFFTALLAIALAGMWRVAAGQGASTAALLGVVGALLPVITHVYLIGFFSQLVTLFVFPALIAICRAGALPRWTALAMAAVLLGFLAAAYNYFWLIGLSMAGGAVLLWPGRPVVRLARAAGLAIASLLLTTGYLLPLLADLVGIGGALHQNPDLLSGFVTEGVGWVGWGHNFIAGPPAWVSVVGVLVALGVLGGIWRQAVHRRWHWCAALAGPGALLVYFFLKPQLPVYAIYKLLAALSPLCVGSAFIGLAGLAGWIGPWSRRLTLFLLVLAGAVMCGSGLAEHLTLVRESRQLRQEPLDKLWAARDRAEARTGADYLVANGNNLIGAWLAYFGRAAHVYYDLPALSDRRVPSEAAAFRKIPAGAKLEWLDLDQVGPVPAREPSLIVSLTGIRSTFVVNQRPVQVMGAQAEVTLIRAEGFAPQGKPFLLEFGLTPWPGTGPYVVTIRDAQGVLQEIKVSAPVPGRIRFVARPGANVLTITARPVTEAAASAPPDGDWLLLQALSIEQAPE